MNRKTAAFAAICLSALALALEGTEASPVVEMAELPVEGRPGVGVRPFDSILGSQLPSPSSGPGSLPEALGRLPGVALQRRGGHSIEPVVRGLGGDRVATRFNGLFLPNASPTRTAAPVNFLGPAGAFELEVYRSFPRVFDGPVGSGGLLSFRPRFDADGDSMDLWVSAEPDRDGWSTGFLGRTVRGPVELFGAGHFLEQDDYGTGDGRSVDADFRGWNASAGGRHVLDERRSLTWSGHFARQDLARNSSLPLDTRDSDYWMLSIEHLAHLAGGALRLRGGYSRADVFLTSEDRPSLPGAPVDRVEARAPARSASFSAAFSSDPGSAVRYSGGVDLDWQSRDAVRTRDDFDSGQQSRDRIWPDVEQWQPGVFVELEGGSRDDLSWRTGWRVERTMSEANAADDPVEGFPPAQGSTIRENYAAFNGPDAASTDREEWTGTGQFILEKAFSPGLRLTGGLAYTVAPPGVGERYRAFLNALGGGFELGNPALDPEHKREGFIRLNATGERLGFGAEVFLADFDDFVQRQVVQEVPLVYSFRNVDARFHGVEVGGVWRIVESMQHSLTVPATFALTEGENRDRGRDLPEVPPWEGAIALRYERISVWGSLRAELGARYVDAQSNPDPDLNPVFKDAKSHTQVDLSFEVERRGTWRAGVSVDNLFDRIAYDYLQPPVAAGAFGPSSGSLSQGDRIPLPGREVRLYFSKRF